MLKFKRLMMIFTVVCIVCGINMTAFANENPDVDKLGSIKIFMYYENKPISGGSFTLYNVGRLTKNNGKYKFVLTNDFADSNVNLQDTSKASEYAKMLLAFAKKNSVEGFSKEIDSAGNVVFESLPTGVYLLNQKAVASGEYEAAEPFLVYIPLEKNGAYIYDINANPKIALIKDSENTTKPDNNPTDPNNTTNPNNDPTDPDNTTNPNNDPTDPDNTTNPNNDPTDPNNTTNPNSDPTDPNNNSKDPTSQSDEKLPYTGQLNWPVPILAISGILLVLCGGLLLGKRKANEK